MMLVTELIDWLKTLNPDDYVGVDESGLCLRTSKENEVDNPYLEIGGIPSKDGEEP